MKAKKYYCIEKYLQNFWWIENTFTNKKLALKEYNELKKWYSNKPGKKIRLSQYYDLYKFDNIVNVLKQDQF